MTLEEKIKSEIRDVHDFPKAGITFKDITPLFLNAPLSTQITEALAAQWKDHTIDAIAGIESRGFLWGILLAQYMQLPFIMIRKKGKLPAETSSIEYALEYGTATIELHKGFVKKNMNVLIHDDLLATGGTALAAAQLIQQEGGIISGFSFVVELDFLSGQELLSQQCPVIQSLIHY